ncbi:MAG: NAD(P)H-quinone oxidoreductase [Betaproteobacteria bacterium SG8_40]|jgi:NADPH2:quinone reductase|nr:MAG: NAD(P)H-quinone oxidoreductase [Betaproteobacteria bacterium SG8_40]
MRAIEIAQPGAPDVLRATTRPVPDPAPGEVLIQVSAAGVNRPDVMQRLGLYPPPPGAPDIPGLEVAGTIVKLGTEASRWKPGDRVCALVAGGGYAQYVAAPWQQCLPVPGKLSMVEAAALPETFFTVWANVFERAALAPGETLLVQGGSSGIGVTAIQLARAFGHRVFVTAGSAEKCRECEHLGAERAIDYKNEDFVSVVREVTGGRGVDVILDMVAGDYVPRELKCLADDGRLVIIAFLGGVKTQLNMTDILVRRLTITGSTLRPRPVAFKAKLAESLEKKVWPLIAAGKIKPVIHSRFALDDARDAHALMESSTHVGKLLLEVDQKTG